MVRRAFALALVLMGCSRSSTREAAPGQTGAAADTAQATMDRRLIAAARIALPPEGLAPESLPDPTQPGARVLSQYCVQCHAMPSPAMHGVQDWPAVTRRMWVRIDMMHGELGVASPTTAERAQLLSYLSSHALAMPASLPAGSGRDVFEAMCSRCHILPDPKVHSPADWPVVVMRMERNMERMRVAGITHAQAEAIVGYLQTASARR